MITLHKFQTISNHYNNENNTVLIAYKGDRFIIRSIIKDAPLDYEKIIDSIPKSEKFEVLQHSIFKTEYNFIDKFKKLFELIMGKEIKINCKLIADIFAHNESLKINNDLISRALEIFKAEGFDYGGKRASEKIILYIEENIDTIYANLVAERIEFIEQSKANACYDFLNPYNCDQLRTDLALDLVEKCTNFIKISTISTYADIVQEYTLRGKLCYFHLTSDYTPMIVTEGVEVAEEFTFIPPEFFILKISNNNPEFKLSDDYLNIKIEDINIWSIGLFSCYILTESVIHPDNIMLDPDMFNSSINLCAEITCNIKKHMEAQLNDVVNKKIISPKLHKCIWSALSSMPSARLAIQELRDTLQEESDLIEVANIL